LIKIIDFEEDPKEQKENINQPHHPKGNHLDLNTRKMRPKPERDQRRKLKFWSQRCVLFFKKKVFPKLNIFIINRKRRREDAQGRPTSKKNQKNQR